MNTARQFVYQIADMIRAKGREVEVTETEETFGTFVWLYAPAPHWYDSSIHLSAVYKSRTGRWSLGEMEVRQGSGNIIKRTKRSEIRIAAETFI